MAWLGEDRIIKRCYDLNDAFIHEPHNYYDTIKQALGTGPVTEVSGWFFCKGCDYVPKHRKAT